jgi:hypothetical protein
MLKWAVRLSEEAAIENKVASSFVGYWKRIKSELESEYYSLSGEEKENICAVYDAIGHVTPYNPHTVRAPGDKKKVRHYLYNTGPSGARRWSLHDAVPERFHSLDEIPDAKFSERFNPMKTERLRADLRKWLETETSDALFSFRTPTWEKEKAIADLEEAIELNQRVCDLLKKGGVDQVRIRFQKMIQRCGEASQNYQSAKARMNAEKEASRLLEGRGKSQ